jgi:hypothetical protein
VDAALSHADPYSWLFFSNSKQNYYNDAGAEKAGGISAMEVSSQQVKKQCVWSELEVSGHIHRRLRTHIS